MLRSLFNSGVRRLRLDWCPVSKARRRYPAAVTFFAACIALCLGVIVPDPAVAQQQFATDIYIAVTPAAEQLDGESVDMVSHETGTVVIPQNAFGNSGIIPFSDKFIGAGDLKKAIDKSFASANAQFEKAGVKFEVRNIYFVSTKNKHIKDSFLSKDDPYFELGIKNNKSMLLDGFRKLTATKTDSFNVLMAPLAEGDTSAELGWAENGGNTSVVDIGKSLSKREGGFLLIHELGHNLGLDHHGSDPFTTAMAPQMPSRGAGQASKVAKPELTGDDVSTIKTNVAKGTYKKFRSAPKSATSKKKKKKSKTAVKKKSRKKTSIGKKRKSVPLGEIGQDLGE